MTAARKTETPKIFRVTLEVSNIDEAAVFYAKLLGTEGKRHPGARHYFDCGGVILSLLDPTTGGLTPTPGPKSLYFAVGDLKAAHTRALGLKGARSLQSARRARRHGNKTSVGRALVLRCRPVGQRPVLRGRGHAVHLKHEAPPPLDGPWLLRRSVATRATPARPGREATPRVTEAGLSDL